MFYVFVISSIMYMFDYYFLFKRILTIRAAQSV